jgi:hypothetical protein
MKQKYLIEFRVRGRGEFPHDMLRYDSCEPRCSDDKAAMTVAPEDRLHYLKTPREIELVAYSETRWAADRKPKEDRWKSFGWEVIRREVTKLKA